jgi:hypothetical protein
VEAVGLEAQREVVILKRINQMVQADKELLNRQAPQIRLAEVPNLLGLLRQADQAQPLDLLEVQRNLLPEHHNLRAVQIQAEVRRLSRQ